MAAFQYHSSILDRFPTITGGVILAKQVSNSSTPESLQIAYHDEQQAVLQRIGTTPLSQIESLAAWRNAFRRFGLDPTQYRSAAEALLRRLTKKGDIPNVNMLVDIGNLVSIRYALPVAVFDTRELRGPVTVRFSDGSERYTPLGEAGITHPEPGDVIFSDETGLVIARRWCWRQSEESAARNDTTNTIITIEAHHAAGHAGIEAALRDLLELLHQYSGGEFISGVLDKNNPSITDRK